ncbi:MAG: ABC transporter permease [Alphaproteobacteria bacterium]|jgi:peptide/nickel transport system permease protein|nr:ABC transporter permease [Alphaproteobacteria bacterium]MDP6588621.1 ABC transporter permease [Alphaproteobacteria bacterium]
MRFHLRILKLAWYAYAKDNAALGALIFLAIIVLISLLAPLISPYDPAAAVADIAAQPGSEGVILGADVDGRDILSRLFWGGRIALLVGIAPTVAATLFSLVLGLAAGYIGGWFDQIVMRIVDVVFAFPLVLLAIVIAGVLEPGVWTVILAISIALMPYIARLVRTTTMNVKQQPYVEAARAGGAGGLAIVLRYILPNMIPPVLIFATTLIGLMMVVGSGLSFLGLGIQPPDADWGIMVAEGRGVLRKAPHITIFPGVVIVLVALSFNFIGDGLRDALDPRRRSR